MKKQRLIALMCAGIVTASSLTSCERVASQQKGFERDEYSPYCDKYIVIEQNDIYILHKGDMSLPGSSSDRVYIFDCGENYVSSADHSIYNEMPKEERYDQICEDCFGK